MNGLELSVRNRNLSDGGKICASCKQHYVINRVNDRAMVRSHKISTDRPGVVTPNPNRFLAKSPGVLGKKHVAVEEFPVHREN